MVFPLGELGDHEIKFKPEHEMFREFIRGLRDVEITKIYEGSNEIRRLVIIRQLTRQTMGFDPMGT